MFLGQKRQAEEQVCWPWTEQSCCSRSPCSQSPRTPQPHRAHGVGWGSEQAQMTSRQDIMHCHFRAGASSTYTRRKTFFRNREEEGKKGWRFTDFGKETGQHQRPYVISVLSPGEDATRLSPSQKQAVLKKLPSSRMPRTGISKDLRNKFPGIFPEK